MRKELANEDTVPCIRQPSKVQKQDSWVQQTIENTKIANIDLERLKRIRQVKLDFCDKNNKRCFKEPDLIRKFVAVD